MIKFLLITLGGAAFLWLGIRTLRTRAYENSVSLVEAAILNTTGEDPLPLTRFDRIWGHAQAWLMIVFGAFFLGLGLLVVGSSLLETE